MKRCPSCDHFSDEGAETCERCGTRLPTDVQPGSPTGGPGADSFEEQVLQTARSSGKIAAIKLYREQRRVGLKEAKEDVEALMAAHGVTAGSPAGGGCSASLLALSLLIIVVIRLLVA